MSFSWASTCILSAESNIRLQYRKKLYHLTVLCINLPMRFHRSFTEWSGTPIQVIWWLWLSVVTTLYLVCISRNPPTLKILKSRKKIPSVFIAWLKAIQALKMCRVSLPDTSFIHNQAANTGCEWWAGGGSKIWLPVKTGRRLKLHRSDCNLFINSSKN